MARKKYFTYESLGTTLTAISFPIGLICGLVSLFIFGPIGTMSTKDWGILNLFVYPFFSALVTTDSYHNIWIRQSLLPAALFGGIYSYFKFQGSDFTISLDLCG